MLELEGAPTYSRLMKIDYGFAGQAREGDTVDQIPPNRAYQACHIKNVYGKYEGVLMLLDDSFLFLIKIDIKNKTRGVVHTKVKHKEVLATSIDAKDSRVLVVAVLSTQNAKGYIEKVLFFDDWRRCTEIRQFFIEEKRAKQLESEKKLVESFLADCEQELI